MSDDPDRRPIPSPERPPWVSAPPPQYPYGQQPQYPTGQQPSPYAQPQQPHYPYGQPQYLYPYPYPQPQQLGQPPYSPQPYPYVQVPRPPRLPLPVAQRKRAWLAGALGFGMQSLGWALLSASVVVAAFWAFFAWLFSTLAQSDPEEAADAREFLDTFASLPLWIVVVALAVAFFGGIALWICGLFVSRRILRRAGHPSPWGVTWAGFGIGVGASLVLDAISQGVVRLAVPMGDQSAGGVAGTLRYLEQLLVWTSILTAVQVVLHVAIGALVWWWMAWAMRARATV